MTSVTIDIKVTKINDTYGRFVGLAIDEPLVPRWWENQPDQNLGLASTSKIFTKIVDVVDGTHNIEAGVASHSTTPWDLEIVIDGVSAMKGSTYSGVNVIASFVVNEFPIVDEEDESVSEPESEVEIIIRPLDRLQMIFQKIMSFIKPEEEPVE